jgi:3-hydroxyisobutyrate dehydrogenase-like beta-hydroxyacid dehydrogenase
MSRRTQKNVGIVGLGIIGQRVAANLRRRGFSVFVWNRTPRPLPNFVGSPAEIATLCDFVQIFVSDDEALLEMVQAMKQSLNAHHVIMAHSTVAPATMRAAAEIVHRRGGHFLDAPFTGSKMAAEKGELVYYIGGDDAAYRRAKPVLEASSKEIIEIGEIGQATTIKLATNMVTAATVQTAAEALALVHSAGLPLEKFAAAMASNGSNSGTLTMKLPKMISGDFEPHFSVKHMLKDVLIATRLARSYGLAFGATEAARDSLMDEVRHDRGDHDYASVVHSFFPDGPPGTQRAETEEVEEQASLAGLDEPAADEPAKEEPPPAPRAVSNEVPEAMEDGTDVPDRPEATSEIPEAESAADVDDDQADVPDARREENADEDEPAEPEAEPEPVAASSAEEPRKEPLVESETPREAAVDEKMEPAADEKNGTRRGFFSRVFGRGMDY